MMEVSICVRGSGLLRPQVLLAARLLFVLTIRCDLNGRVDTRKEICGIAVPHPG